ncbi:MAG: ribosomal large subunit pseudouridine synthase D, partial [Sorangium cellulosum]
MSPARERLTLHVELAAKPRRLDAVVVTFLRSIGREVSRSTVRHWIDAGRVKVDGAIAKAASRPRFGCVVEIEPAPPPPSTATPDPSIVVDVLYQDEHLLVVNKPANLVVHPARGHLSKTLVNGLLALDCFEPSVVDRADPDATLRPGIVHRLDKDTSGVLVVARTGRAREGLKALFAHHDIDREYQAVVVGKARAAVYNTAYGRHPSNRFKFTSMNPAGERRAITTVQVQESLPGQLATCVR